MIVSLLLVAGCGAPAVPDKAEIEGSDAIECAVSGAREFAPACAVERSATDKGLLLTIHHPDGGFCRLLVTTDGRGVIAADGAEEAVLTPVGDALVDVALGRDRYRLPATIKR